MTDTEKIIAKHREVYRLSKACTELTSLAAREHTWIMRNPDASSRCIELQKLKHETKDYMHVMVALAWGRCLLIDKE